jgi:Bifunctional DNA primase/polymerase, N-terminal/Primase C terminal 1 (PriCT-1)
MAAARMAAAATKKPPEVYGTELRSQLFTAALDYARRGWPVFPCKPGSKKPLIKDWPNKATTEPGQIAAWWGRWPEANVAIVTGERSGILAVDVDDTSSLYSLEDEHGNLPATLTHGTGSGGMHLLFRYPDENIRNSASKIAPGIDTRGEGGYILAPPSRTTRAYQVLDALALADAPAWVLEKLRRPHSDVSSEARGDANNTTPDLDGPPILEGTRNSTLTSIAGRLHDNTRDLVTLTGELLDVNAARCTPPLPDSEVERIAESVYARTPCKRVFQPSPEVLDFVDRHRSQVLHARGWRGRSGPANHDGYEALLDLTAEHGRVGQSGSVHVRVSVRDFALRMGTSRTTANKVLQRLQQEKLLYRIPRMTSGGVAGEIVLRNIATQELDSQSIRLGSPLTVQGLRTLLRRTRYGAGRLGKLAELALRAVLLGGGEATTSAVAANLERRGCDVRRTLRKLVTRGALVECSGGDRFRLAGDLAVEYARVLDEDGVPERERKQRADDERAREAYRNRHQVKPERVPEKPPAGEIRELERVPDADPEILGALAAALVRWPDHREDFPSWWASTLYVEEYLPYRPTPQQVESALLDVPNREGVAA